MYNTMHLEVHMTNQSILYQLECLLNTPQVYQDLTFASNHYMQFVWTFHLLIQIKKCYTCITLRSQLYIQPIEIFCTNESVILKHYPDLSCPAPLQGYVRLVIIKPSFRPFNVQLNTCQSNPNRTICFMFSYMILTTNF